MLSFATEFPTRETSPESFVASVREWLSGSPHSRFPVERFETFPSDGYWSVDGDEDRLEAIVVPGADARVAFRYLKFEGDLTWTTTVVYAGSSDEAWVGIRTFRTSAQPRSDLPTARKPFLVRTLLQTLGGGLDAELFVSDKPHHLQANDVSMVARLLNGDADNHLPVVYVSRNFDEGLPVNVDALSRALGGLAHVLVEPDRAFSRALKPEVSSRNAYGGTLGAYLHGGLRRSFYLSEAHASEHEVRQAVVGYVRAALMNRRPLARCTWEDAELLAARAAIERLRSSGSGDVEEYIKAFDAEARALEEQVRQADAELHRLRAQVRALEACGPTVAGSLQLAFGDEVEFFPGEFKEVVLDALADAKSRVQSGSRRDHIISAVEGIADGRSLAKGKREDLKAILRNYQGLDRTTQDSLVKMGFSIREDGKHYKLIFANDERYTFSLAKSPSDRRGGLNLVSDISKILF